MVLGNKFIFLSFEQLKRKTIALTSKLHFCNHAREPKNPITKYEEMN